MNEETSKSKSNGEMVFDLQRHRNYLFADVICISIIVLKSLKLTFVFMLPPLSSIWANDDKTSPTEVTMKWILS
ncbi:MAG: hypothetical protein JO327_07665 [Nitrososphaeraceae archaeon]|nr:hypothetical protein [Nitrososphaeraceae archaeon]MBV9667993.1 hypothetical protein [Nitrososphaeraceae archaeon]